MSPERPVKRELAGEEILSLCRQEVISHFPQDNPFRSQEIAFLSKAEFYLKSFNPKASPQVKTAIWLRAFGRVFPEVKPDYSPKECCDVYSQQPEGYFANKRVRKFLQENSLSERTIGRLIDL